MNHYVNLSLAVVLCATGCRSRSYNSGSSSHSESTLTTAAPAVSEADTGFVLPVPVPIGKLESAVQAIGSNFKPILDNQVADSKVSSLSELYMTKGLALMVSGFEWREGPEFCRGSAPCQGAALKLEGYSPVQTENSQEGMLFLRKSSQGSEVYTAEFSEKPETLSDAAFSIGSPVSLNVFKFFVMDQVEQISGALKTKVLWTSLDSAAAQAKIATSQILVSSMISAVAGSPCRSPTNPCRDSYFHLVVRSPEKKTYTNFGTMLVHNFLNDNDPNPDSTRFFPVGEHPESGAYDFIFPSPMSIDSAGSQLIGSPSYVRRALEALLADKNFAAERASLSRENQAIMLVKIAAAAKDGDTARVVTFSLETYSPTRENKTFGKALVTLTPDAAKVAIER